MPTEQELDALEAFQFQPGDMYGQVNPPDDGFGMPGNGEFNTPSLVEAYLADDGTAI